MFLVCGMKLEFISWTAEMVESFVPRVSVPETEISKMHSQYSRVIM